MADHGREANRCSDYQCRHRRSVARSWYPRQHPWPTLLEISALHRLGQHGWFDSRDVHCSAGAPASEGWRNVAKKRRQAAMQVCVSGGRGAARRAAQNWCEGTNAREVKCKRAQEGPGEVR